MKFWKYNQKLTKEVYQMELKQDQ